MELEISTLLPWGIFLLVITVLIIFDLKGFHKDDHVVSIKESMYLTAFYVVFALLFGIWIYFSRGLDHAQDYYLAFVIEKSLALDNIFVFTLIFKAFHVPPKYQHRVLFYGIVGVVVLRGLMLAGGIALVQNFEWVIFIFGAFLVFTGVRTLIAHDKEPILEENALLRFLKKFLPVTHEFHGHNFFARLPGKNSKLILHATPLFLALVTIEFADIIFAVDSIPAVLAITLDPYIVYTSNIFAILGLRALYFAWSAIMYRFVYLKYSLGILLIFIGCKIFAAEFIGKIPPAISLTITLGILGAGAIFSIWKTSRVRG